MTQEGSNDQKLLVAILLAAIIIVYGLILAGEPKGKPRKLTPAEQRDSLNPKKKIAKG